MRRGSDLFLVCAVLLLAAPQAYAVFTFTLQQVVDTNQPSGFDVTVTGSGSLQTTFMPQLFNATGTPTNGVESAKGGLIVGISGAGVYNVYDPTFTGPTNFGSTIDQLFSASSP